MLKSNRVDTAHDGSVAQVAKWVLLTVLQVLLFLSAPVAFGASQIVVVIQVAHIEDYVVAGWLFGLRVKHGLLANLLLLINRTSLVFATRVGLHQRHSLARFLRAQLLLRSPSCRLAWDRQRDSCVTGVAQVLVVFFAAEDGLVDFMLLFH